ncbi:MAG: hypothetical protein NC406_06140 [Bacteroides sp.]|nr:hypothetical protein [Bacteroides sp.]MCM1095539.1 hypothetical protein [Terasakiella sp.]
MNKLMGYILIAIGIIATAMGIILLTRRDIPQQTVEGGESVVAQDDATRTSILPEGAAVGERTAPADRVAPVSSLTAKEKGDAFEDFVVNLLADYRLTLLDRTQDAVSSAGVVAESCKNPDLHVKQKHGKSDIDYYLECKYRSHWADDAVTFDDWQIKRYRQFQRDNRRKVIIALGVGGSADSPATLRLVPVDSIKKSTIRKIDTKYAVDPTPSALVEYMSTYFTTVFSKSKSNK